MLYITFDDADQKATRTIGWHVGADIPYFNESHTVTVVQADGDELEYITANCYNIPVNVKKRVNRWHGEFANFIARNIA